MRTGTALHEPPVDRDAQGEPVFCLPGRRIVQCLLLTAAACIPIAGGVTWGALGIQDAQVTSQTWVAIVCGVLVALLGNLLGLAVLWPPAKRAASIWTSVWMGASALRIAATGGLAALLYFRSPGEPRVFVLVTGFTYLALLVAEAATIATVLGPMLGRMPDRSSGASREPTE